MRVCGTWTIRKVRLVNIVGRLCRVPALARTEEGALAGVEMACRTAMRLNKYPWSFCDNALNRWSRKTRFSVDVAKVADRVHAYCLQPTVQNRLDQSFFCSEVCWRLY